jgi:phage baseplate assembly protein W
MANSTIYSDFDLALSTTDEGDITVLYNLDAIKQAIKNIVLTPIGSRTRYQDPDFGCGVFSLLSEKVTSATAILIQEEISMALGNYEPRIEVVEVNVDADSDNYTYEILIKYRVLAVSIEDSLTIDLEVLK